MKQSGFSILEVLVVIGVLVILVTITAIGYGKYHDDSRDTARRAAVQQVEAAINTLKTQKDRVIPLGGYITATGHGLGSDGLCTYTSGGWLYAEVNYYPCSLGLTLRNAKLLPNDFFDKLQPNEEVAQTEYGEQTNRPHLSMMIYNCVPTQNRYLLYYYLKNPTQKDTDDMAALRSKCTSDYISSANLERYKMRAAVEIKL